MSRTAYAKVSTVSPPTVLFDGDPVNAIPALCLSSYTPVVGDRVRVEVRRSGLLPIIQSKVS